jgi:hypothetical protein
MRIRNFTKLATRKLTVLSSLLFVFHHLTHHQVSPWLLGKDLIDRSFDTDSIFRFYRPTQSVAFKLQFFYRRLYRLVSISDPLIEQSGFLQ